MSAAGRHPRPDGRKVARPLGAAGRTVVSPSGLGPAQLLPARPESACGEDPDEDWRQMRAAMRGRRSSSPATPPKPSSPCVAALNPPADTDRPDGDLSQPSVSKARLERASREFEQREHRYFERAKNDARAHMSACFEDLIGFFEMHNISGAYALAFAAHGVENLSDLLLMEESELNRVIEKCELDAVDEIMLREALRSTRGM